MVASLLVQLAQSWLKSRQPARSLSHIMTPAGWGDINKVIGAPLQNVAGDAYWLSVFCMWRTLPISCIQGVIAGLCKAVTSFMVSGSYCCQCIPQWLCCSDVGSVECGQVVEICSAQKRRGFGSSRSGPSCFLSGFLCDSQQGCHSAGHGCGRHLCPSLCGQ